MTFPFKTVVAALSGALVLTVAAVQSQQTPLTPVEQLAAMIALPPFSACAIRNRRPRPREGPDPSGASA